MSVGRPPTYSLAVVQAHVAAGQWVPTFRAMENAAALRMDPSDIADCVLGLDEADFYKTMPSQTVAGTMQDVYRPTYLKRSIYLKLQLSSDDKTIVIQFKKDQSR